LYKKRGGNDDDDDDGDTVYINNNIPIMSLIPFPAARPCSRRRRGRRARGGGDGHGGGRFPSPPRFRYFSFARALAYYDRPLNGVTLAEKTAPLYGSAFTSKTLNFVITEI